MKLQKKYIKNGKHIIYKDGKNQKGKWDLISLNIHCGIETSKRDDIEWLGYNLRYYIKGKLSEIKQN